MSTATPELRQRGAYTRLDNMVVNPKSTVDTASKVKSILMDLKQQRLTEKQVTHLLHACERQARLRHHAHATSNRARHLVTIAALLIFISFYAAAENTFRGWEVNDVKELQTCTVDILGVTTAVAGANCSVTQLKERSIHSWAFANDGAIAFFPLTALGVVLCYHLMAVAGIMRHQLNEVNETIHDLLTKKVNKGWVLASHLLHASVYNTLLFVAALLYFLRQVNTPNMPDDGAIMIIVAVAFSVQFLHIAVIEPFVGTGYHQQEHEDDTFIGLNVTGLKYQESNA